MMDWKTVLTTIMKRLELLGAYCVIIPVRAFTPAMFFIVLKNSFFSPPGQKRSWLKRAIVQWARIEIIFFIYSQITRWRVDNTHICLPIATEAMRQSAIKKIFAVADHVFRGGAGRNSVLQPFGSFKDEFSFVRRKSRTLRKESIAKGIVEFSAGFLDPSTSFKNRAMSMEDISRKQEEDLQKLLHADAIAKKSGSLNTVAEDDEKIEEESENMSSESDAEEETESESEDDSMDVGPDAEFRAFKRADFLSWFNGVTPKSIGKIYRGNLEEWIRRMALFPRPPLALDADDLRQVSDLTDRLIAHLEIEPRNGYNPDVTSIDMMNIPIHVLHRPFIIFASARLFIEAANFTWSRFSGFTHFKAGFCHYYYRAPLEAPKPGEQKLMPLVFIHGLGFGPVAWYSTGFLQTILGGLQGNRRQVIVLSFPHIQMRPGWENHCPSTDEMVATLTMILHAHKAMGAHFIGHSMGTIICAWFASRTNFVKALTLIDPVCLFSLNANAMTQYFKKYGEMSGEAKLIQFFCFQDSTTVTVAIKNQFPLYNSFDFGKVVLPCCFFVAGSDPLIPGYTVKRLLEYHQHLREITPGAPSIQMVFEKSYTHGTFLTHGKDMLPKVQAVDEEAHQKIRASRLRKTKGGRQQPSMARFGNGAGNARNDAAAARESDALTNTPGLCGGQDREWSRYTSTSMCAASHGQGREWSRASASVLAGRESSRFARYSTARYSTQYAACEDDDKMEDDDKLRNERSSVCPLLASITCDRVEGPY